MVPFDLKDFFLICFEVSDVSWHIEIKKEGGVVLILFSRQWEDFLPGRSNLIVQFASESRLVDRR